MQKPLRDSSTTTIIVVKLKMEQCVYNTVMFHKTAKRVTGGVESDKTAPDLGLHCFLRPSGPSS